MKILLAVSLLILLIPSAFALNQSSEPVKGIVTHIVDGDTLDIQLPNEEIRVRLTLVNTPERGAEGYKEAKTFTSLKCPTGTKAILDPDSGQTKTYGRNVGLVSCEFSENLNADLLKEGHAVPFFRYCSNSEFADDAWSPCK